MKIDGTIISNNFVFLSLGFFISLNSHNGGPKLDGRLGVVQFGPNRRVGPVRVRTGGPPYNEPDVSTSVPASSLDTRIDIVYRKIVLHRKIDRIYKVVYIFGLIWILYMYWVRTESENMIEYVLYLIFNISCNGPFHNLMDYIDTRCMWWYFWSSRNDVFTWWEPKKSWLVSENSGFTVNLPNYNYLYSNNVVIWKYKYRISTFALKN